jgi:hypothetical protein
MSIRRKDEIMAEPTELKVAERVAMFSATNALLQALHYSTSRAKAEAAVYYIGQHAVALMKLTVEREHVVLYQKKAGGGFDFHGFAPNPPEPDIAAECAAAASSAYRQARADFPAASEYTERDAEMFARGAWAYRAAVTPGTQPWFRLEVYERSHQLEQARRTLGIRAPGEPR